MAKQPLIAELYYAGAWHQVPIVYTRDEVTITGGRGEGAQQPVPSTARLTIGDRAQQYDPSNPAGDLYGLIGRNTPLRIALRPGATSGTMADARDTYTRTVPPGGWGTADVGGAWSAAVVSATTSVSSGAGRHDVTGTPGYALNYLAGLAVVDVDQVATVTAPAATGADLEVGLVARGTSVTDYVMGRAHLATSGAVTVKIYAADDTLLGTAVVAGLTHSGQALRMRMRVVARDVFFRIWEASGTEPTDWHLHAVDTTAAPATGWIGIRSGRSTGNTNSSGPQFAVDDYSVIVDDPRFFGEVASWQPYRSIDFDAATGRGDAWVEIEAAGVLRRLGQGEQPSLSPWRRTITAVDTVGQLLAYWPCEDARDSSAAASALPGGEPMAVSGSVDFAASGEDFARNLTAIGFGSAVQPGTDPLPSLAAGGRMVGAVPDTGVSSPLQWAVCFTARSNAVQAGADIVLCDWTTPGGTFVRWEVVHLSAGLGSLEVAFYDTTGTRFVALTSAESEVILTKYRVQAWQDGANIVVYLYGHGNELDSTAYVTQTLGRVRQVRANPDAATITGTTGFHIGHIQVWDAFTPPVTLGYSLHTQVTQITDTDGTKIYPWYRWLNETAADRLTRICAEQGITLTVVGNRADTYRLGQQSTATLADLLSEPEATDGGLLYEDRVCADLLYRTRVDLYNQTPALSLDYSAGEVAPPLRPVIDDLAAYNDVLAVRPDGSSARVVQTTGPLNTSSSRDDPQGIGRVPTRLDCNPALDGDLPDLAGWHLAKGVVEETRYPRITVDLDAHPELAVTAAAAGPGDVEAVTGLEPDEVRQVVGQVVETIGSHRRTITFGGVPASPYTVGVYDAATSRYDSAYSTVEAEFVAGTDTSLSVAVGAGRHLWVTGSGSPQFPLRVRVAGVVLEVTAISGSSSPQTMTVTATPVNGVTKTIAAGQQVRLADPVRYGL